MANCIAIIFILILVFVFPTWVILLARENRRIKKFRQRPAFSGGNGMRPLNEIEDRRFFWTKGTKSVWGLTEHTLRSGNDSIATYWVTTWGSFLEAETANQRWVLRTISEWFRTSYDVISSTSPNGASVIVRDDSFEILAYGTYSFRNHGCGLVLVNPLKSPLIYFEGREATIEPQALPIPQLEILLLLGGYLAIVRRDHLAGWIGGDE